MSEDRFYEQLDAHFRETHPEYADQWQLDRAQFADHRLSSPVEPCDVCGKKVYLMQPKGWRRPVWCQFGEFVDADTLFPQMTQKRHQCGDGDSWSVEAALFVESALAEWGVSS